MRKIFYLIIIGFISIACAIHQKGQDGQDGALGQPSQEIATTSSKFNQKLADSLGADNYGMKSYKMVILKTGAKDKEVTDKAKRAELFQGHFSNMEKISKEGKLIVAGPMGDNHLKYRGIFILDVKTDEEAKNLIEQDPTVKAGVFDYEILPWYGSAALPMHLKYHEKVAKENP